MQTADVIVIGGGVLGGAVAFYLAKQKAGRVIMLERHSVAQGNSSLAAGLLTHVVVSSRISSRWSLKPIRRSKRSKR